MSDLVCRACGSTDVIPDAIVNDHDSSSWRPLGVTARRAHPVDAGIAGLATSDALTVPLAARVCGACGLVEFSAPDAAALWAAYRG